MAHSLPTRRALLLGSVAAGLTACGFHLRQPADLPYSRIALAGFAKRSHMAEAMRRNLPPGARLVDNARDAEVVVQFDEPALPAASLYTCVPVSDPSP